jgi:hypothetical protein
MENRSGSGNGEFGFTFVLWVLRCMGHWRFFFCGLGFAGDHMGPYMKVWHWVRLGRL